MEPPEVLRAELVHAEPGRWVVQVSAWEADRCLGSSLGEADSAEQAEDRAVERLRQRLALASRSAPGAVRQPLVRLNQPAQPPTPAPAPSAAQLQEPAPSESPSPEAQSMEAQAVPPAAGRPASSHEPAPDPEDWSEELAEIDVQLQRIGWDRNQEATYLQRAYGHPSRHRLTSYADLASYLRSLRTLPMGSDPGTTVVPLRRRDLLQQCDQLLETLRWDANRGRQLLEQQFQLGSRQQLSDEQLLQFNMLLEEAVLRGSKAS